MEDEVFFAYGRHWETGKTKTEDESEPGDLLPCVENKAFGGRAA